MGNKKRNVIFLGAGASCADGAPAQEQLFRDYFLYNHQRSTVQRHQWDEELHSFFLSFFGIDTKDIGVVKEVCFPTFEEVLGMVELAAAEGESFRGWGVAARQLSHQRPRIKHMHDVLILLIAEILDSKLRDSARYHPLLIESLLRADELRNTTFISLNYDIIMDNALLHMRKASGLDLDYGIDFMNPEDEWQRPARESSVRLYKLHGSLNWLFCPTCRAIRITPQEEGICRLKWRPEECVCPHCATLAVPIIIPPTYFKSLPNFYLDQIWHAAEMALIQCDRIVFCGYSLPNADIRTRYLMKRMELSRRTTPDIFIVNEPAGKSEAVRRAEQERFRRFFRDKDKVHWEPLSFEDFCVDPSRVLEDFSSPA